MRVLIAAITLVITFLSCKAQNVYQAGILPSITLNKKLPANWRINFNIQSRQQWQSGDFETSNSSGYDYLLTDVSIIGVKKVALNTSIGGGYLTRFEDKKVIHRSIQQVIITTKYSGFRLAHRILTDQTFEKEESVQYRLRYRLSARIPLNGRSLDPKEFYLKVNHEYLNQLQGDEYDLGIRLAPYIGYSFSSRNTLELGLDYRLSSFIQSGSNNQFWGALNWYFTI